MNYLILYFVLIFLLDSEPTYYECGREYTSTTILEHTIILIVLVVYGIW